MLTKSVAIFTWNWLRPFECQKERTTYRSVYKYINCIKIKGPMIVIIIYSKPRSDDYSTVQGKVATEVNIFIPPGED